MVCIPKMLYMTYFGEQLTDQLLKTGLTKYRLAKLSGVPESSVINITNSKRRPSDDILEKFAGVEKLSLTLDDLRAWRALDDYGPEALAKAYDRIKKDRDDAR